MGPEQGLNIKLGHVASHIALLKFTMQAIGMMQLIYNTWHMGPGQGLFLMGSATCTLYLAKLVCVQ